MSHVANYLLMWIATAVGVGAVGLVLIVEAFAAIALVGAARRAATVPPARGEPNKSEQPRA